MEFLDYYKDKKKLIEKELRKVFPEQGDFAGDAFIEMINYPLIAKSKRIRPVLILMSSELFGGKAENCMNAALAIELIHSYSLVHDDLPAMDNDDMRRGKPTVHVKFGEANAILVGDSLLTHAFALSSRVNTRAETALEVTKVLSNAAGYLGMVGGQYLDLRFENKEINLSELKKIHALKTGALLKAAAKIGAICAEAQPQDIERMSKYGDMLGLAFQIKDDILDVTSSNEELGKPVGSDAAVGKSTYVKFLGLEGAEKALKEACDEAIDALSIYNERAARLIELVEYVAYRKN